MKLPLPVISLATLCLAVCLVGCTSIDGLEETETIVKEEGDKIFIVDDTGKEWDITYAVEKYNMRPELFQHGVGPNVISPLINPQMLSRGDRGYPEPDWSGIVIGITVAGESRAYATGDINAHEVVDETFIEQDGTEVHVAVGW